MSSPGHRTANTPRCTFASRTLGVDDSAMGWEADIAAKYGLPLDQIPGQVYVLHYEVPQVVKSVSLDYAGPAPRIENREAVSATPIRHYVGWTQQRLPRKRINRHGPAALREIVYLEPGTTQDEETMKQTGTCPKCGESLAASLASPVGRSWPQVAPTAGMTQKMCALCGMDREVLPHERGGHHAVISFGPTEVGATQMYSADGQTVLVSRHVGSDPDTMSDLVSGPLTVDEAVQFAGAITRQALTGPVRVHVVIGVAPRPPDPNA